MAESPPSLQAPVHHFGDKAGLLTAVAIQGHELLAAALRAAWAEQGEFLEVGVAYVDFATTHRAHFEVMSRPDLYRAEDEILLAARAASAAAFYGAAGSVSDAAGGDARRAGVAGWALMHGIASLWLTASLPPELGSEPTAIARDLGGLLFQNTAGGEASRA